MIWPFNSKDEETDRSKDEEGDRSVFEVSNDKGDHWVGDVPSSAVDDVSRQLKDAGAIPDRDEQTVAKYINAAQIVDSRDGDQHRFKAERVIDEREDLEDNGDREEDKSDSEYSEQIAHKDNQEIIRDVNRFW